MNEREIIEGIYGLVKYYDLNAWDNKESRCLQEIKSKIKEMIIMYDYHDNYGIDIKDIEKVDIDKIIFKSRYGNICIRKFNKILNCEEQPKNELLMSYSFPTGPYIFDGTYYFRDLFATFFEELKRYKYSYLDDTNEKIYFEINEGMKLFKNYKEICEKYQKLSDEKHKEKRREELEQELSRI